MKYFLILMALFSANVIADKAKDKSPEQLFVLGTELFKKENAAYDPKRGLKLMLKSAKEKYEFAPFGLCVALSDNKEVLDLVEAYSWCYVAERIPNKYSSTAKQRGERILSQINSINDRDSAIKKGVQKWEN